MSIRSLFKAKIKYPAWVPWLFLSVSLIGFIDATYLTIEHYLGNIPLCSLTSGCENVLTSQYSIVFGIPVALLGAAYYLLIFLSTIAYFDTKDSKILQAIAILTPIGFLMSVWFVYTQLYILKAICEYCMLSAATSTILFIGGTEVFARWISKQKS